jgi:hypothetical protein
MVIMERIIEMTSPATGMDVAEKGAFPPTFRRAKTAMRARRRFSPLCTKMAPKPVWQLQDQRRAECGSRPVQNGCDRQVILRLVIAVEKKLVCQAILIIRTVGLHCQHGTQT